MLRYILILFLVLSLYGAEKSEPVNALIHEESPYLQQHAHNPVHWMPWGQAAFEKARREHKPIFLSIGYSTCHWCHVMERESFENPEVARLLNRYFVAIKVDREEHPPIDRYYQSVHRLMTHRAGGWPLTLLLTPDRKPFFAATYLPREERYNQPGLLDLLRSAAGMWQKEPQKIEKIAVRIDRAAHRMQARKTQPPVPVDTHIADNFVKALKESFDREQGGWGMQPKFPRATTLTALLRIFELTQDRDALRMATKSLDAMAMGGIYDQIEGGFYRYSTDRKWMIPHFEKMLYSNAELLEAYAIAARVTDRPLYRRIVREIVAVFIHHYRDPSGLFYGASDADSLDPKLEKKKEGYYYTYRYDRLLSRLKKAGISEPAKALAELGITENGNFIAFRSNPYLTHGEARNPAVRRILRQIRARRPYPFIDKKMQTSWNALWIHSLLSAAPLDRRYGELGLQTLESLMRQLYIHGRLYHQKLPGRAPKVPALLEDYSFLIAATLDAYDLSQEPRWLRYAATLMRQARQLFRHDGVWMDGSGGFRNPLDLEGGSYRSPLAVLADDMLRLAVFRERLSYQHEAEAILKSGAMILNTYPQAAPMGVIAWLADRSGYILVKLPGAHFADARRRIEARTLYPFLLFRKVSDPLYQACRVDRCFLYDSNASSFINHLTKTLK